MSEILIRIINAKRKTKIGPKRTKVMRKNKLNTTHLLSNSNSFLVAIRSVGQLVG